MSDNDTPQKDGKAPMDALDGEFLQAMARQLGAGSARPGRKPGDYRDLDPHKWLAEYRSAMQRHAHAAGQDDTGESHYAAVAANAMICDMFERRLRAAPVRTDVVVDVIAERFGLTHERSVEVCMQLGRKLLAQQEARQRPTRETGGDLRGQDETPPCECGFHGRSRVVGSICHNCGGEIVD